MAFRPANGARAEVGWKAIALTYTEMSYTDPSGHAFDAGAAGVTFTLAFGGRH